MDGGVSSSLGAVALGVLKSEGARNILMRFFHKVWKRVRLKKVECIVVNDIDRVKLKFKYDDAMFQYLDVEAVYLSLLSDGEIARLSQLKKMNARSWILSVKVPCKSILTKVRELWKNETVVLCVSNAELARELHVSDSKVQVYVQDKEYHEELCEKLDEQSREYLGEMLARNKKRRNMEEYKSFEQLVERLEKKFS